MFYFLSLKDIVPDLDVTIKDQSGSAVGRNNITMVYQNYTADVVASIDLCNKERQDRFGKLIDVEYTCCILYVLLVTKFYSKLVSDIGMKKEQKHDWSLGITTHPFLYFHKIIFIKL